MAKKVPKKAAKKVKAEKVKAEKVKAEVGTAVRLADCAPRPLKRVSTGLKRLDDALGGGLVLGSTTVIVGPPGVGKTTLLLQVAANVSRSPGRRALYASAEQSEGDVRSLLLRLRAHDAVRLSVLCDPRGVDVYEITAEAERLGSSLVVVDSIQTSCVEDVTADFGSTTQVLAVMNWLTSFAKMKNVAVLLVCHTRKDGCLAGPYAVEHLADAVCYLSPARDETGGERWVELSVDKHRHGPCGKRVDLRMTERGFVERGGSKNH